MLNKPIKQSYKIYGFADHGYIYNWFWSSREKGYQNVYIKDGFTNTGRFIRAFTLSLPRRFITIYLDNYFILIPFFLELRAYNFGAVGTTMPYKEFLKELIALKTQFSTKLEWNTLAAAMVKDILCLA